MGGGGVHLIVSEKAPSRLCAGYSEEAGGFWAASIAIAHYFCSADHDGIGHRVKRFSRIGNQYADNVRNNKQQQKLPL